MKKAEIELKTIQLKHDCELWIKNYELQLSSSPNPATNEVHLIFNLPKAGKVQIALCSLSGIAIYKTEKVYDSVGLQSETLHFDKLNLPQGLYCVKVFADGMIGIKKVH